MLYKIGKAVFSKIKNQQTESEKDEREFLWKIFSRGWGDQQINQKQWNKSFWLCLFKDVGCKGLQQKVKHFRDQEKVVWRNVYELWERNNPIFNQYLVYVKITKFDQKKQ